MDDSVRTAEEDHPITATLIFSGREHYRWVDADKMFHAKDLARFLYFFRIVYGVAHAQLGHLSPSEFFSRQDELVDDIRRSVTSWAEVLPRSEFQRRYFSDDLADEELFIETLAHGSPLSMTLRGLLIALTTAIILSGGSVQMGPTKFEVHSLGSGLQELAPLFAPLYEGGE